MNLKDISIGPCCRKLNPGLFQEQPVQAKRIRQEPRKLLDKLEEEFMRYYSWEHGRNLIPQSVKFRLGNGIWYKPDFIDLADSGVIAIEVKGPHIFRGGIENLKVAAGLYPQIVWQLWWKEKGMWAFQIVFP